MGGIWQRVLRYFCISNLHTVLQNELILSDLDFISSYWQFRMNKSIKLINSTATHRNCTFHSTIRWNILRLQECIYTANENCFSNEIRLVTRREKQNEYKCIAWLEIFNYYINLYTSFRNYIIILILYWYFYLSAGLMEALIFRDGV